MAIVTKNSSERVMFFIDVRNVIKGCNSSTNNTGTVDFSDLVEQIADGRPVTGAYIFDGRGTPEDKQTNRSVDFHQALQYQGFRVRVRDTYNSESRQQKEVDMDLGTEMLWQAFNKSFDVAVIVSGDRDFVPAVEKVQSLGLRVEVAAFEACVSNDKKMMRIADRFVCLDTLPIVKLRPAEEDTLIPSADTAVAEAE